LASGNIKWAKFAKHENLATYNLKWAKFAKYENSASGNIKWAKHAKHEKLEEDLKNVDWADKCQKLYTSTLSH